MGWDRLIDDLKTRDALAGLSPAQTEAAVAVLAVVMHADDRVGLLEQHEFESLVDQLPFHQGKDAATAQVEAAIGKAKAAGGEDDYRAIIDAAAVQIDAADARAEVLRLAAAMAYADAKLDDAEVAALGWLTAAFGIDPEAAERIYAQARG